MQARKYVKLLAGLFATSTLLMGSTISVLPATETVSVGQIFNVTVQVSAVADLYGYQFDIGFDPAILAATTVSQGAFLATGGATLFVPGTIDNVAGSIPSNAEILNGAVSGVTGDGILINISFQAMAPGTSSVSLFNVLALNSVGQGLSLTSNNASVTVSPSSATPEPVSGLLAGLGLVGLVLAGRSRR